MIMRPNWRFGSRPVVLTETEFGIAGRGKPQMHSRSEVGRVISAIFAPELRQHVFVLDRHDRLLLRLRGGAYSPETINQFVDALGAPVTDFPDIITRPQAGHVPVGPVQLTDYPGYITPTEFDQKHPGLLSERDFKPRGESPIIAAVFVILGVAVVVVMVLFIITVIINAPGGVERWR